MTDCKYPQFINPQGSLTVGQYNPAEVQETYRPATDIHTLQRCNKFAFSLPKTTSIFNRREYLHK
jgi:hypothetical protein